MKNSSNRKKSKPTQAYSSISIAIVLFLVGLFMIIFLHARDLTNVIKEKIGIIIELSVESDKSDADAILADLKKLKSVKEESTVYIPKNEGWKLMNQGLNLTIPDDENPFLDIIRFNINAEYYSESNINKIINALKKNKNVNQVYHEDASIIHIKKNLNRLAIVLLGIGLIFVFLAIVIIRNTIRLSMYSDKEEIKTMQLIGAKRNFIKMPYIKSSVLVGFNGFVIAAALIFLALIASKMYIPDIWQILNFLFIIIALVIVLAIAIIIPAVVTNGAANKYLDEDVIH